MERMRLFVEQVQEKGRLELIPPSGNQVEFRVMDLVRYRDGQRAEHWAVADAVSLLRQTGALG